MFLPAQHLIQQNQQIQNAPDITSSLLQNLQGTFNQQPTQFSPSSFFQLHQQPNHQQNMQGMHQMGRHPSFHAQGFANAFNLQSQNQFQNPYIGQQNVGFQNRPQNAFGFQFPQQQGFQQPNAYQPGFQQNLFQQPGFQSGFVQPQPQQQNFNQHPQYGGQGGANVNYF